MPKYLFRTLICTLILHSWPLISLASPESDLYQFNHYKLDNGLSVVLKQRTHAPSVSIRLAVEVGHRYFPCEKSDTAHFLEHMLFMGTTNHSENELDDIIESNGGSWNAETRSMQTVYEIDIYSKNIDIGLNTLFEIMTESTLSHEDYETAKQIVYRESDGEQAGIVHWLFKYGIGKSAISKLSEWVIGAKQSCEGPINMDNLYYDDIKNAFSTYYQPNNMTLVIVGDFEDDVTKSLIVSTFGKLVNKETKRNHPEKPEYHKVGKTFYGTLEPLLGSDAYIFNIYRTEGNKHKDHYPLVILSYYLSDLMYEQIRVEKGLAYSPDSDYSASHDYGLFSLESDANISEIDEVVSSINEILETTIKQGVDEEGLNLVKNSFKLAFEQGYEKNLNFADYYTYVTDELREKGTIDNMEEKIEAVTVEDVNYVLNKYFDKKMAVVAIYKPFMTYTQFYSVLVLVPLGVVGVVFVVRRKKKKMRQEQF